MSDLAAIGIIAVVAFALTVSVIAGLKRSGYW